MAIIVASALIVAVLSPLYHLGRPPCLSPVKTAVWLIAKPATASCVDCHGGASGGHAIAEKPSSIIGRGAEAGQVNT